MKRTQYRYSPGFNGPLERAHVHCRVCGDKVPIFNGLVLWRNVDGQDKPQAITVCKGSGKRCGDVVDPERRLSWTLLRHVFMTVLFHHGRVQSWKAFMDAANYKAANREAALAAVLLFDAGVRSAAKWRAEIASMKAWHAAVAHVNRELA